MHLDVHELRSFYLTPMGRTVRQLISARIRETWPDVKGRRVVGVGHTTPFLRPFIGEAERVIAVMPAAEGVLHWPREGPNRTLLAYDQHLPLPDASVDCLLVVHALEATDNVPALLRELWRVLVPSGRLLVVVAHRSGLWARTDTTPFGIGRPFSRGQLSRLAEDSMFAVHGVEPLLFTPPTAGRLFMGSARTWERIGRKTLPQVAGAIALDAQKRMSMGILSGCRRQPARILAPVIAPGRAAVVRARRDAA